MMSDRLRRIVDVVAACVGSIVLAPLMVVISLLLQITVGSPVIHRQRRLGIGGRPFELFKFRSMRPPRPGRANPEFDAERITRLGRWLRSTSLDELPSLWNLLRGDVALVGPRPLPVLYWQRFRRDEYERFTVRPGITGLAQITGRNLLTWDDRLALDVDYVRQRTLVGDLRIVLATVPAVLSAAGVDADDGVTMTELPDDRR